MPFIKILGLIGISALAAAAVFFTAFPVRRFAKKIKALDVPRGERHRHSRPTPLLGGICLFFAFALCALIFTKADRALFCFLIGALLVTLTGALDDKYDLRPWVKLVAETLAALVVTLGGTTIEFINIGGHYLHFGVFAYPITILWIVALTNGINLIDGLDGLACGVSGICAASIFAVSLLQGDYTCAVFTAAIFGGCAGFLPHNMNDRRKFFLGDTGALFLGFVLSTVTVRGLFKTQAVLSFIVPVVILGLPIFDTGFAFFRRIAAGKNPFCADRAHLHHRIMDMGFSEKQTVCLLFVLSGALGCVAVVMSALGLLWALFAAALCVAAVVVFVRIRQKKKK